MTTDFFKKNKQSKIKLDSGSTVGVVGGGPAGSLCAYFLLKFAQRVGMDIQVDIYEPRNYTVPGPVSCNMCGGVISESLVQALAVEGINLPSTVVQRGIDSYVLHMDAGSANINTPLHEKRIAVVHRGAGPRLIREMKWRSFDGFLLELAKTKGASHINEKVETIDLQDGFPFITTKKGSAKVYDFVVIAVGVNASNSKLLSEKLSLPYRSPVTTKTYICEYYLGIETIEKYLGNSMHMFLLNIPRLEFGALIPKGDYVSVCLLGEDIDKELVAKFLNSPEVKDCLPPDWIQPPDFCHCSPKMNIREAYLPYGDRMVFVGDCGVSRLYKDGIGAAYRTSKAAALTAIFEGVSKRDFRKHYFPVCDTLGLDNAIGKLIFLFTKLIQKIHFAQGGVLKMVSKEQAKEKCHKRMSMVLWDVFTGSAPYRDIFRRTLNPAFWIILIFNIAFQITHRKAE
ncbi:MAG: hypothetical protein HYZ34_02725 [Ignavibacteriae bacterium]|nr:hypothetical protein [Ignavibacteriota bacterium]